MNKVPQVRVGIMNEPVVDFVLNNEYRVGGNLVAGNQHVEAIDGKVVWNGQQYDELLFEPVNVETDSFTLIDVTIGVSFHWRRKEVQSFRGALHLIVENGKITTVNVLSVEEYLLSVISSEMSAKASLELLKAHAVISRSWLLAQIYKDKVGAAPDVMLGETAQEPGEEIKWWDRDDHINFDVCADDHCQRYQGITRASTETVKKAIEATWGQVLMYGGNLCDARFSKSCGGVFEEFENCWQPQHYDYLVARRDGENPMDFPDLTREDNAAEWILSAPAAFCNTSDPEILSQVLNDYDQETKDFYRWTVEYTQDQISTLIKKRTGIQHTTSWGLRRTVSKDLQYLALLAMLLIIDIGLSALSQQLPLFSMPLLSTLGVITISVVEAISVAENTRKGKAPEDDKMDDIQQLVMAVADKLGKDKTKAFLQALEEYEKGKKA